MFLPEQSCAMREIAMRALVLGVLAFEIAARARAISALATLVVAAVALILVSVLEAVLRRRTLESAPNLRRKATA